MFEYCIRDAEIYYTTREEYDCLMKELENAGYRWASGDKPTEFDMYLHQRIGATSPDPCTVIKIFSRPKIIYTGCHGEYPDAVPFAALEHTPYPEPDFKPPTSDDFLLMLD